MSAHRARALVPLFTVFAVTLLPSVLASQQAIDEEYTRLIAEHLTDARISTELVDYLPASDVVPTTLEFPSIVVQGP